MAGIFISYRREDTAEMCDRLDASLAGYFGRDLIFKDKAAMVSGRDFADQIRQAVAQSNVQLVLIGPRWMSLTGASGVKRILEPEDYVRAEIEMARQHGVAILPVLVNLAPMPGQTELPSSIAFLSTIDAAPLRVDPDYPWDTQRLIEKILTLAPQMTPRFDPAAALAQARRGAAPAGWRVWRPGAGSVVRRAFTWLIGGGFLAFFAGFMLTILSLMGSGGSLDASSASNMANGGFALAGTAALIVGVIAGVIGLITGISNASTGYLVLTPDGVVQAIGISHNSASFAEVENVSTSVEVHVSGGGQNAPATVTTRTRLAFLMRDGTQRVWGVRREFGNVNATGQAIIAAHNRYSQAHKGLGVPGLPQYAPPAPIGPTRGGASPAYAPAAPGAPFAPTKPAPGWRRASFWFTLITGAITGALAYTLAFSPLVNGTTGLVVVIAGVALAGGVATWRARAFLPSLALGAVAGAVFSVIGDVFAMRATTYGAPPPNLLLQDAIAVIAACALAAVGGGLALLVSRLARRG